MSGLNDFRFTSALWMEISCCWNSKTFYKNSLSSRLSSCLRPSIMRYSADTSTTHHCWKSLGSRIQFKTGKPRRCSITVSDIPSRYLEDVIQLISFKTSSTSRVGKDDKERFKELETKYQEQGIDPSLVSTLLNISRSGKINYEVLYQPYLSRSHSLIHLS